MTDYDVDNVSDIYGVIVESWKIGAGGRTYTCKIRENIKLRRAPT